MARWIGRAGDSERGLPGRGRPARRVGTVRGSVQSWWQADSHRRARENRAGGPHLCRPQPCARGRLVSTGPRRGAESVTTHTAADQSPSPLANLVSPAERQLLRQERELLGRLRELLAGASASGDDLDRLRQAEADLDELFLL